ncbi:MULTISPECIES: acetylxylan esterase [unclassified Microbacterium]|uniref:acetylxylan esterase n=1 Tax=unclassified Microbacterium TaxID=2609290 RepID=UPI000C2B6633|nr:MULTISPECIES: acetylxylan esterase [unclassified Microbacterium]
MAQTDLPLETLRVYRPEVAEPSDFDEFWADTLAQARTMAWAPELAAVDTPIDELVIEDLTFAGFGGEPIKGWVTRPRGEGPWPTVVEFIGYGGGRGLPGERLLWAASGYAHVLMDTRGQGSGWGSGGDTPDPHGSGAAGSGYMTRGITAPETYFYRRVFTDGALLIDAVRALDFADPDRIAVTGGSQGGAISLAVAGLSGASVRAVMPDVPFLCHFRRSVELTPEAPFTEVAAYLAVHRGADDNVFRTLSYFDGVNFARRIEVPALFSVGLMDPIVLPSSVFTAYNHLATDDREIEVYAYNGHEGGGHAQWVRQARWLAARMG